MSECDALRAELQRISQQIAALDSKFIPVTEKPKIYNAIGKVDGKAESNASKILNIILKIAQIVATIATAQSTADGAANKASSALSLIGAVKAGLEFVLGELRQYVIRERFNALENRVSIIENGLDILTRLAQSLAIRIGRNESAIAYLKALIEGIQNVIVAIQRQVTSLIPVVNSNRERINRLEALTEDLDRRVRSLAVRVESLAEYIEDLKRRMTRAEAKILANEIAIRVNSVAIAALIATVTALGVALATLGRTVAGLVASVAALGRAIASLVAQLFRVKLTAELALRLARLALERALQPGPRGETGKVGQVGPRGETGKAGPRGETGQVGPSSGNITVEADPVDTSLLRTILQNVRVDIELDQRNQQLLYDIRSKLSGSGSGVIDLSPCDADSSTKANFGGSGLNGLYSGIQALSQAVNVIHADTKCVPTLPVSGENEGEDTEENSWPVIVPSLLTQSGDDDETTEITGMPQAIAWIARNLDAVSGQYPIEIQIKDTDPLTNGDQSQTISLPNQAEAIAELFGLAYESNVNSELAVNMIFRLIPEVIATKNSSLTSQDYVQALTNWAGFRTKAVGRKVDSNFNPLRSDSFADFLKPSKYEIQGVEDDDPHTLVEWVQQIKYAVAIMKASVFRSPKESDNLQEELKAVADNPPEDPGKGWETFIDALNRANSNLTDRDFHPRPRATAVNDVLNPSTVLPDKD